MPHRGLGDEQDLSLLVGQLVPRLGTHRSDGLADNLSLSFFVSGLDPRRRAAGAVRQTASPEHPQSVDHNCTFCVHLSSPESCPQRFKSARGPTPES